MSDHLKEIGAYWDARSSGFSDASLEELETEPARRWTRIFMDNLPEGCAVLDDGAGAGFFTVLLASLGHDVTAIDYSAGMLTQVRRNLETRGLEARTMQMDAQRLDFPDGHFDAVVSRNVLWNLDRPDLAYAEAARVLRPGGVLILEDGNYYLHLHNAEYAGAAQARQKADLRQDNCHARHNPQNVDFSIIERIAGELPMSRTVRPAWDFGVLAASGFRDIRVRIEGSPLPQRFLIIAKKGEAL